MKNFPVFYKGHKNFLFPSYPQALSFTTYSKGHNILSGPKRAGRQFQDTELKKF